LTNADQSRFTVAGYMCLICAAVCSIVLAACLGAVHLLSVRYLNQQLLESLEQRLDDRIKERTRIARELHDSLLQGFQGVMFRLEAVRALLPHRAGEAADHLDVAIQRGLAAINEGRQTVSELRASGSLGRDLTQALAHLREEFVHLDDPHAAPDYCVLVQGHAIDLEPIVRDETYSIVREAVRNAFRHAHAKQVEVECIFGKSTVSVHVRDDGIGLDPAVLKLGHRKGHWGLPGMRERALGFGAELQVWSRRDAGTEIRLRIAGRIAYMSRPRAFFARIDRES
jgi:signal transduction histidine kinase